MIPLTSREWLNLEMAASGYISGELREWPLLVSAFAKMNIDINLSMNKREMQKNAYEIMSKYSQKR